MTAQVAAYGRLGVDPIKRTSRAGQEWATASIAVDLGDGDQEATQWFDVVAFGRIAETLCKHSKGDLVSVCGRLKLNRWQDQAGNEREQLRVIADTVMSARTVRQGGARRPNPRNGGDA